MGGLGRAAGEKISADYGAGDGEPGGQRGDPCGGAVDEVKVVVLEVDVAEEQPAGRRRHCECEILWGLGASKTLRRRHGAGRLLRPCPRQNSRVVVEVGI